MTRGTWAASGRPVTGKGRPAGSWGAAVERAREAWDGLAGGPERCVCGIPAGDERAHRLDCREGRYSDRAAAAILSTALGLWADTAATLDD